MTPIEAKEFLIYFKARVTESNSTAYFKSSRPLAVSDPDLFDKKIEAEIVLGVYIWQKSFEDIKKIHPSITIDIYNKYRDKHCI